MSLWHADPPQGATSEESLHIIGKPLSPRFAAPQGLASDIIQIGDWFDTLWLHRIELIVNPAMVPSEQTDFPTLIKNTYPSLIGVEQKELRFAGIDKVQLQYEIQKFDNLTGELIAWVNKPTINDGDILYIYYDNVSAVDEQDLDATWPAQYKGVYHLEFDGKDSSGNAQDLEIFGTDLVPGKIGNARDFNGTVNDYLIRNPFNGFPMADVTYIIWIKSIGTDDGMISYATNDAFNAFLMFRQHGLSIIVHNDQVFLSPSLAFNDGTYHQIVVTWKSSTGEATTYLDSVLKSIDILAVGLSHLDNGSLVIGQDQDSVGDGFDGTQAMDGILDEPRIIDVVKNQDYITTQYNNQNDNGLFFSVGNIEALTETENAIITQTEAEINDEKGAVLIYQ